MPQLLGPLFSSHLAFFKCNIPRSLSHKPKQARFKYNIPRSRIEGLSNRGEMTWGRDDR